MIQASAQKLINFSDVDLLNRREWLRMIWLLDQLESDNCLLVFNKLHDQQLYALTIPNAADIDKHWDSANNIVGEMEKLLFPWSASSSEKAKSAGREKLLAQWNAVWGDPGSEENKKREKATVRALRKRRKESQEKNAKQFSQLRDNMRKISKIRKSRKHGSKPKWTRTYSSN